MLEGVCDVSFPRVCDEARDDVGPCVRADAGLSPGCLAPCRSPRASRWTAKVLVRRPSNHAEIGRGGHRHRPLTHPVDHPPRRLACPELVHGGPRAAPRVADLVGVDEQVGPGGGAGLWNLA